MSGEQKDFDYIIIGSGFGGSVSALRLAEKGYRVAIIEKGKWFKEKKDFPATNWDLKRWLWAPSIGLRGMMQLRFFRHVTALSGVAVGGGSIVYANTLPVPGKTFFESGSWKGLCDWENELKPFYALAKKMLGAEKHPYTSKADEVMKIIAQKMGVPDQYTQPDVAVHFGEAGKTVSDPYFEGKGPDRTGCIQCGGCMLGCAHNAKNTLDKNYLYLAQQLGATIFSETEVLDVIPANKDGSEGYKIVCRSSKPWQRKRITYTSQGVVFAGGVLGTIPLLLKLQKSSLPKLSQRLGHGVRTNSESLIGVTSLDKNAQFSDGIAISSIIKLDANRFVEPVRYPPGSGFWRLFMAPMVRGSIWWKRLWAIAWDLIRQPVRNLRVFLVDDWSKRTLILLYMESIESTLRLKRYSYWGTHSTVEQGEAPSAFNPKAQHVARETEKLINGKAMVMNQESILGIPTTAHILGGACIGGNVEQGVIDPLHRIFNYVNLYVCDGSAVSANPGVNPSLTITAMAERAMSYIPPKNKSDR